MRICISNKEFYCKVTAYDRQMRKACRFSGQNVIKIRKLARKYLCIILTTYLKNSEKKKKTQKTLSKFISAFLLFDEWLGFVQ